MCNQLNWIVFWYEAFICVSSFSKRDTNNIHSENQLHTDRHIVSLIHFLIPRWWGGMSFCPSRISIKSEKQHNSIEVCYKEHELMLTVVMDLILLYGLKLHFLFLFGFFIKISVSFIPSFSSLCFSIFLSLGSLFPNISHISLCFCLWLWLCLSIPCYS